MVSIKSDPFENLQRCFFEDRHSFDDVPDNYTFEQFFSNSIDETIIRIERFNNGIKGLHGSAANAVNIVCYTNLAIPGTALAVLKSISSILSLTGWGTLITICALLALGSIWWYGSMAAFIVSNPCIAALVLVPYGITIIDMYNNKQILQSISNELKTKYENPFNNTMKKSGHERKIEMKKLQNSLVIDIARVVCKSKWRVNYDEFFNNIDGKIVIPTLISLQTPVSTSATKHT